MKKALDIHVQHGYPNINEPLLVPDVCIDKKGGKTKSQNIGETGGNQPVPQELQERSAGETVHEQYIIMICASISIIAIFIFVWKLTFAVNFRNMYLRKAYTRLAS